MDRLVGMNVLGPGGEKVDISENFMSYFPIFFSLMKVN